MKLISVTNDVYQKQTLILDDGTTFVLTLKYIPMQIGWFITNLVYENVTINNMRVCTNMNILNQFKNQLPFGIACQTTGNREPTQLEDFQAGASSLYLLTADEVDNITELFNGQIST